MTKFVNGLIKILEILVMAFLATAVIVVVMQIVSRYLIGTPLSWTEQVARYLFIWMMMLGLPIMFHRKIFMAFDLILTALPKKAQFVINITIKTVSCAFACYYFWYSIQLVIQTWGRYTSGFKVPLWTLYGAQPVFCVCLFFVMLNLLLEDIKDLRSEGSKLQNTVGEGGNAPC